jgi:L-alanine-DL-glutamate epimerase-like enolase superfamily enzyme
MSSVEVNIDRFEFRELRIPFKVAFRHAAAERTESESVWVDAVGIDGTIGHGESCPRPYVTGETVATARAFTNLHQADVRSHVTTIESLDVWIAAHQPEIDANPAAWCAMELAVLDLLGQRHGTPVETLLSVPSLSGHAFQYTAILGDAPASTFHAMAEQYWKMGFRDFKVKLSRSPERDREKMAIFRQWPEETIRVRADANNLWNSSEEAVAGLCRLDCRFFAVEEPIGKDRHAELPRIASALGCPIVLDESFARRGQLSLLAEPHSQWLINLRVSKMGGLIRSVQVIEAARACQVGVIVGAQVGETSLLTRAALTVARAAGDLLVAHEGAFGTFLLERDVCDPPLMFGAGGILDGSRHPMLTAPGLGLSAVDLRRGPG